MKKFLFVALAASMLFSFAGCKKKAVDPKDIAAELAKIIDSDDCAKAAKDLDAFVAANGEAWKTYLITKGKEAVKGKAADSVDVDAVMADILTGGDKSVADKLENGKCANDAAVKKITDEKSASIMLAVGEAIGNELKGDAK